MINPHWLIKHQYSANTPIRAQTLQSTMLYSKSDNNISERIAEPNRRSISASNPSITSSIRRNINNPQPTKIEIGVENTVGKYFSQTKEAVSNDPKNSNSSSLRKLSKDSTKIIHEEISRSLTKISSKDEDAKSTDKNSTPIRSSHTIKNKEIIEVKELPLSKLSQMSLPSTKTKSKRKDITATPEEKKENIDANLKLKRVKFNAKLFDFCLINKNSCRFDCMLLLLCLFQNKNYSFLKCATGNPEYANELVDILAYIDNNDFVSTQSKFREFVSKHQLSDDKTHSFGSFTNLYSNIFELSDETFSIKFSLSYWCTNPKCPIAEDLDENPNPNQIFIDFDLADYRDASEGILSNFWVRNSVNYRDKGICDCSSANHAQKSVQYTYEKSFEIETIPQYLAINMESLKISEPKDFENLHNTHIESIFTTEFRKKPLLFTLISIIYFENGNHYTLAFKNPSLNKETFDAWCYYDSKLGYAQEFGNMNLSLSSLVKSNRLPVFIIYEAKK